MLKVRKEAIAALSLRLLLSAAFFYTALVKVRPIEPFEFTLVETGLVGWDLASFLARGIVGLEFAFSLLLLIGVKGPWVRGSVLLFLLIMSLYLIALLIVKGNVSDCGCLGAHHSITPTLSLIKNAGMIAGLLAIGRLGGGPSLPFYPGSVSLILLLGSLSVPFIIDPPRLWGAQKIDQEALEGFPMEDLRQLEELEGKALKLDSGEHLLAFMSTRCHWCRLATRKLGIMDERTERALPYHFFLAGDQGSEKRFWEETRVGPYPSTRLPLDELLRFANGTVPAVVYVEDGVARARLGFNDIREEPILKLLEGKEERE